MERNNNPQTVTLAKEMYEELVRMADSSPHYSTRRIRRHARKFNPHLQQAHQELARENEVFRSKSIADARKLVSKFARKTMYAKAQVYLNSDDFDPVYVEVIVRRICPKNRMLVEVYPKSQLEDKYKTYCSVSSSSLIESLPEDYIEGVGVYNRYMVKANGNTDHREDMAKRELRQKELDAAEQKVIDDGKKVVAFDVITEQ